MGVPAWAETGRREAVAQALPQQRRAAADRWLDEPWRDLARNLPGYGLIREAAERRRAGESDLSWRIGADGEDIVASTLRLLTHPRRPGWGRRRPVEPSTWSILHGVKVGSRAVADIDHVLIGPPGLIVINTKKLDPRYPVRIKGREILFRPVPHQLPGQGRSRRTTGIKADRLGARGDRLPTGPRRPSRGLEPVTRPASPRRSGVAIPRTRRARRLAPGHSCCGLRRQWRSRRATVPGPRCAYVNALPQCRRTALRAQQLANSGPLRGRMRRSTTWTRDVPAGQ